MPYYTIFPGSCQNPDILQYYTGKNFNFSFVILHFDICILHLSEAIYAYQKISQEVHARDRQKDYQKCQN